MAFNRSLGGLAVGLIALFALTGCGGQVVKEWNLSDTAPFSAYTGKEVTLSRDVLLVADRTFGEHFEKLTPDDARIQWHLRYPADLDVQQLEKERAVLLLPAGTPLHVQRTTLSSDQYYYFFYLIHMEGVGSNVIVRLNEPGWPREVQVFFTTILVVMDLWYSVARVAAFARHHGSRSIRQQNVPFIGQKTRDPADRIYPRLRTEQKGIA